MIKQYYSLGLIGFPLEHSYSKFLHEAALKNKGLAGDYSLMAIRTVQSGKDQELRTVLKGLRDGKFSGLNVTVPYKRVVIPYLDGLTTTAATIGAVNTIYLEDEKIMGDNTDAGGFIQDLTNRSKILFNNCHFEDRSTNQQNRCLILGAGGASRAVAYSLATLGWEIIIAARNIDQSISLISSLKNNFPDITFRAVQLSAKGIEDYCKNSKLLVNATSVGMFPDIHENPWPDNIAMPSECLAYDLVYNPENTKFLLQAKEDGLNYLGGAGMLVEQARTSFKIWTGYDVSSDVMFSGFRKRI